MLRFLLMARESHLCVNRSCAEKTRHPNCAPQPVVDALVYPISSSGGVGLPLSRPKWLPFIPPLTHLRSKRRIRRSRHSHIFKDRRGQIPEAISIRERPAEVEDRAIPGHWEGDLLRGSGNSHIATLVERQSRFVMLIKIPSRDTAQVVAALSKHVRKLPATLRRSLTWDRGLEMAKHKDFTVATDVKVYFCDPQSPWQRGSNENTNGLLRQYFPKNTDLTGYSQSDLNKVALRLNQRPRQTLGFQTPASKLQESVASTH
jgi:IS30 family transposase